MLATAVQPRSGERSVNPNKNKRADLASREQARSLALLRAPDELLRTNPESQKVDASTAAMGH